jgi:hypothetical protein
VSVCSFADEATRDMVYQQLLKMTPLKLYGGNVELIGEDKLVKQELAQWIKLLLTRTEAFFGQKLMFDNHMIRLVINNKNSSDNIFVTTSIFNNKILQRIVIADVDNFDLEYLERILAETLIKGYVYDSLDKRALALSYKNIVVPVWMQQGLARNFYNSYKEENSEKAYIEWMNGNVLPLRNIFENIKWENYTSGVFFNSIKKQTNYREHYKKIFTALAHQFDVDYFWMQQNVFNLDDETYNIFWDNTLYIQKNMIYTSKVELNDFERYLLEQNLYSFQGYSGIPESNILPEAMSPIMIIPYKDAQWISSYIDAKPRQLQVEATGKSQKYREITEMICEYIVNINSDLKLREQIEQYRNIQNAINEPKEMNEK